MKIYCCGCGKDVSARLIYGEEIYPHRKDLHILPFWKCDTCGNYVGTHYKTSQWDRPLGSIPTPELREARQKIHAVLDPLWKSGRIRRGSVYKRFSGKLGYQFHSAEINTLEQAEVVYEHAMELVTMLEAKP